MNFHQGSSLNRTPFKNEIKDIKTGASSTYEIACFNFYSILTNSYSVSIV